MFEELILHDVVEIRKAEILVLEKVNDFEDPIIPPIYLPRLIRQWEIMTTDDTVRDVYKSGRCSCYL